MKAGDRVRVKPGGFPQHVGRDGVVLSSGEFQTTVLLDGDDQPTGFIPEELTRLLDREKLLSLHVSKRGAMPSRYHQTTTPPSVRPSGKREEKKAHEGITELK